MVREAMDVVYPGKKVVMKDDVEPQSEVEEGKMDMELIDAVIKEVRSFNEAAKNYEIANQEDII